MKIKLQWLIPNKVSIRTENGTRNKEGHFIRIKGLAHLEGMTILNIKQKLMELYGETHKSSMMEISTPLSQ